MSEAPEDCSCLYCRLSRMIEAEFAADPGSGPRVLDSLVQLVADLLAACHDEQLREQLITLTRGRLLDQHLQQAFANQQRRRSVH